MANERPRGLASWLFGTPHLLDTMHLGVLRILAEVAVDRFGASGSAGASTLETASKKTNRLVALAQCECVVLKQSRETSPNCRAIAAGCAPAGQMPAAASAAACRTAHVTPLLPLPRTAAESLPVSPPALQRCLAADMGDGELARPASPPCRRQPRCWCLFAAQPSQCVRGTCSRHAECGAMRDEVPCNAVPCVQCCAVTLARHARHPGSRLTVSCCTCVPCSTAAG